MKKLLLLLFLIPNLVMGDDKFIESYKKDYIKYLNKCSDGASLNSSDDGVTTLAVFTGINLNESCLYHEFKKHHKEHKIKDLLNKDKFLSINDIEIKDEGNYKTITGLFDFTCGEVCKVGKNIILYDNEKYIVLMMGSNNLPSI